MHRVVILGPGGAGKSTLATRIGELAGLPVIELDKCFWRPGLLPTPRDEWASMQRELVGHPAWIMDGDLGPFDVLEARLAAADTVIVLNFSRWRCALRAVRRSRERIEFWRWLWNWHRRSRPPLMAAISLYAPSADLHLLPNLREVERFIGLVKRDG